MNATPTTSGRLLKDDLARLCLPSANRDPNRKLAWTNSICILFLVIGIFGARRSFISIRTPPPLVEPIPIVIEPPPPPPPTRVEAQPEEQNNEAKPEAPQVVAVTIDSPAVNFSVPTIGNLVVPNAVAAAPPAAPLKPIEASRSRPTSIVSTGSGGDRPQPPYPKMSQELAQQGTVLLSMTVDENGLVTAIEVKESSGFPMLDRSTLDFVKKHWILPPGAAGRVFEAPIRYVLAP